MSHSLGVDDASIFIVGANGQVGKALQQQYPAAQKADIAELDITNQASVKQYDWSKVKIIINAAAYTNVDGAESSEGRIAAWQVNAAAPSYLATIAAQKNITLIHISTDYVFDGSKSPHSETEAFSPLSVYGASKAAGDIAASFAPNHYIVRTSWVIGDGKNFVRTMLELGQEGVSPTVVADQIGRLTFTDELVNAIDHLLNNNCQFGTYNVSNGGETASWAEITREIFKIAGYPYTVTDITTADYYKDKPAAARRPLHSELDLSKIQATGFSSNDWRQDLQTYIKKELAK